MKFTISFLFIFLASISSNAQKSKEANFWYFGNNAGIEFRNNGPVALTNGRMRNLEGVASMSNSKGELLFYTDGLTVYDKRHATMLNGNGLGGNNSSTQSAVIVPQPRVGRRYYLFTVDEEGGSLRYSIIDTARNFGNGEIISNTKNRLLLRASTEKITAVKHANKTDYWIIAHEWGNNKFYAYLLNSNGLSSSPVVTSIGPNHNGNTGYSKGYMKVSPSGTKLALAVVGSQGFLGVADFGRFELYDFNNSTGKVSNAMVFNNNNKPNVVNNYNGAYGIEFSPNERFLYVGCWGGGPWWDPNNDEIYQFDLQDGKASFNDINNSAYRVADNGSFGGLQLGPDGAIYITRSRSTFLDRIEKPNCPESQCSYKRNAVSLAGRRAEFGLPTFLQDFFSKPEFEYGDKNGNTGLCFGDSTQFWVEDDSEIDSIIWNFDDPASGFNNIVNSLNPKHVFSNEGIFNVKAIFYRSQTFQDCALDTVSRIVIINPKPKVNLGNDTILCAKTSLTLSNLENNAGESTHLWSNNSTSLTFFVNSSGIYWLEETQNGCSTRDSIEIQYLDTLQSPFPKDSVFCGYNSITLLNNAVDSMIWNNNPGSPSITISKDTVLNYKYFILQNSVLCSDQDSIKVTIKAPLTFSTQDTINICEEDSIHLAPYTGPNSYLYQWNNGSKDSAIWIKNENLYVLQLSDSSCQFIDSTYLLVTNKIDFNLKAFNDTVFCATDDIVLRYPNPNNYELLWNTNSTEDSIFVQNSGKYTLKVKNDACEFNDSININTILPFLFSLPDTTICSNDSLTIDVAGNLILNYDLFWFQSPLAQPVDSGNIVVLKNEDLYWLEARDKPYAVCFTSDSFQLTVQQLPSFDLGQDTTLCFNDSMLLSPTMPSGYQALWDNGSRLSSIMTKPNKNFYAVTLDNGICTLKDSIEVNQFPEIKINLGNDTLLCDTDSLILTDNDLAYTTNWYHLVSGFISSENALNITSPGGTYYAIKTNGLCEKLDTIAVSFSPNVDFSFGNDTSLCEGDTLFYDFAYLLADSYLWNDGTNEAQKIISENGNYSLLVKRGACESQDNISVNIESEPSYFLEDLMQTNCDPLPLPIDLNFVTDSIAWQDGYSGKLRTLTEPGVYPFSIINQCGSQQDSFVYIVDPSLCDIDFPNAFSPNNDGLNDMFYFNSENVNFIKLTIYNRWGEILFSGDPKMGWDGTYDGKNVQNGLYPYQLEYSIPIKGNEKSTYLAGIIHLIR